MKRTTNEVLSDIATESRTIVTSILGNIEGKEEVLTTEKPISIEGSAAPGSAKTVEAVEKPTTFFEEFQNSQDARRS